MDVFAKKYGAKHDKAVTGLSKDRKALLACLTTSRPITGITCAPQTRSRVLGQSRGPVAFLPSITTVRHRTVRTKGAPSQRTARLMVFKLVQTATKTWRRPKGANRLPMVIEGITFNDGVAASVAENRAA